VASSRQTPSAATSTGASAAMSMNAIDHALSPPETTCCWHTKPDSAMRAAQDAWRLLNFRNVQCTQFYSSLATAKLLQQQLVHVHSLTLDPHCHPSTVQRAAQEA
jgi:hypothetical protein